MLAAETNIIMDPDVADYSQYAASRLDELVARPAKPGETDDYLSDGSPYKPEHTIITANGIKPASVMSWIHREKPGSPAWEQRARQRFMEQNGGDWRSAG